MPTELAKETMEMTWKEQTGRQSGQILLEGDMIVPDSQPDLKEILRCTGKVHIGDKRINDERIGFSGELEVTVLYTPKNGERSLYTMKATLPLEDFIHIDGLGKDAEVTLETELEHLDCEIINDRKIGVKAVIGVNAMAEQERSMEIVCDAEGDGVECLRGTLQMETDVAEVKDRFTVKEELVLPSAKPQIGEMLWEGIALTEHDVRPMDGKVMVRGNLKISVLYTDGQEGHLGSYTERIPFSGYLEGEGIDPHAVMDAELWLEDAKVTPMVDEDGETRQLAVDVTVGARLKAREAVEKEILMDAYVPGQKMELQREMIVYPVTVANGKNQFTLKERVELGNGEAPMLRAEEVWGEVRLEDVRAMTDAVEAEGVLVADILYYCEDDTDPICMVQRGIPFTQMMELKGVNEGDNANVRIRLDDMDFQMLSETEGELRATMTMESTVRREETAEAVTDIILLDEPEERTSSAGAVIYMVQPGDTLWSIAKEYETTIEDILAVNDIENPALIYPDQKLLIVKIIE